MLKDFSSILEYYNEKFKNFDIKKINKSKHYDKI